MAFVPLARRWAWSWFLGYALVVVIGYRLLPLGLARDVAYVLIGLTGALAIGLGIALHRPPYRVPWYLIGVGQLLWVVGDVIGTVLLHGFGVDRFPSATDVGYLVAYPLLAAGFYLLVRRRIPRHDLGGLLDSLIVTIGVGLLLWVLLAEPMVLDYQNSWTAAAVALAYPAGDLLLVGLLVRLIMTPGGWNASLRLLSLAVALLIGADTTASALNLLAFDSASAFDFVWLMSYMVWGAAALHPSMAELALPAPEPPARFSRRRLVALTVALLVAPVTLAVQQVIGLRLDVWAVVIASLLMFLVVVGRMKVAIDEIVAANRLREQAQADLAHQAAHDPLTGLPNRLAGLRLIDDALDQAQLRGRRAGLLFIDLDEFKKVNDTLGHEAGDQVLCEVAARMRATVRRGDVLARLGGDEFVVLLQPVENEAAAVDVAHRIVAALSRPIVVGEGYRVRTGASIGVAVGGAAGVEAESLLREADTALYRAKASGRGRVEAFDRTLRAELSQRAALERALARAIEADELVLHFQPIVSVATGEVHGYEALVRWARPDGTLVPPLEFVPVAEYSELICDLDAWVMARAAEQLARWNVERGSDDLIVSVNVSGRHIGRSRFIDDVLAALAVSGVGPNQLLLEITETAITDDTGAEQNLNTVRGFGVLVGIDDFGTGHASIARLQQLPVDLLKIDRRYVAGELPASSRLLALMVQAGHAFGLRVVAEGVETPAQLKVLKSLDCDLAQGYLFAAAADASTINVARSAAAAEPLG